MPKLRTPASIRLLSILIGVAFLFQLAAFGEAHAFHQHPEFTASVHSSQGNPLPRIPEACHCDFCLVIQAPDLGSVFYPPAPQLNETAFAVIAAYPSFSYPAPILFSPARGPPALS